MNDDVHAPLREDVRKLGEILGQVLRQQGGDVFETVERIRQVAVEARATGAVDMSRLAALLRELDDDGLLSVARAFSQFLNLANIAEQHHRERLWRHRRPFSETDNQDIALEEVIDRLEAAGVSGDAVMGTLRQMSIELVLTAHPTEVTRRTLIRKYDRVAALLKELDHPDLSDAERNACHEDLARTILGAWATDEIRRQKPTPVDEAKWGFATIEQSLWYALPAVHRALSTITGQRFGQPMAPLEMPLRFASWMGGDRDGNPNVTAAVTREVLLLARWMAADLYLRDVEGLLADLSMQAASDELLQVTGASHEPYRVLLRHVRQRLRNTRDRMEALLEGDEPTPDEWIGQTRDLEEPLTLIDRSLRACGMAAIADGELRDTLCRLSSFGVVLLRLDIRQESTRHTEALDAITRYLDLGPYREWPEEKRQQWLLEQLAGRRPLFDDRFLESQECSQEVAQVLETCRVIAEQPADSMGAYVISMARAPSDVLAVYLLQSASGVRQPMRVVPLFETLADLDGAAEAMARLLTLPWYRQQVAAGQEVMIGYSDSAKDAGFLAAAWAQFRAQEALTALYADAGIPLTLFHGRGGSISRGGSPARMALLSQPPGSVQGRIRVTEQGEVIRFKYGLPVVATQHLEQYVAATLEATLLPPAAPENAWREEMNALTSQSVETYRAIVRDDPALVPYLRTVTPEQELTRLALGSRPARRRQDSGVASLRAIPWVFAWTQMRLMLPAWLGSGAALRAALDDPARARRVREMMQRWSFFQGMMDMLEMVLAKADAGIADYYERRLTDDDDLCELGARLRQSLADTTAAIRQLSGDADLLANNPVMRWSISVRNPYTDPLHLLQAELMARLRADDSNQVLESALMVTIAGIAAGMRNTG